MTAVRINEEAVREAAAGFGVVGDEALTAFLGCSLEEAGFPLIAAVTTRLRLRFVDAFTIDYGNALTPWWAAEAMVSA